MNQESKYISYQKLLDKVNKSEIKKESIAITDYISVFLPTKQFNGASYVAFVAPMGLKPQNIYGQIKSIWFVSGFKGNLIAFIPQNLEESGENIILNTEYTGNFTIKDFKFYQKRLSELLEVLAIDFFTGIDSDNSQELKAEFKTIFSWFIDPVLMPFYEKTAKDFLEWLNK